MNRLLITFSLWTAILIAVSPAVVFATARPPIPTGETTYDESYVPCGTEDTMKRQPAMVTGSDGKKIPKTDDKGKQIYEVVSATHEGDYINPATGALEKKTYTGDGIVDNPCGFSDIIELAKRLIMGLIIAGVTFATMGFSYAGFLYITAMGSSEKITHAHGIFIKTFWGFVFMLSAWLIAYAMESVFLSNKAKCNSFLTTAEDRAKLGCDE